MAIPKRVTERLVKGVKQFQPILDAARARDINEDDTVTIVTDILANLFGYDKYSEITAEYQIRGTYCDLAIKIGGEVRLLVEVKAIGLDLKEKHLKQATDYAANEGVEWVALTNGVSWKVYKMQFFSKPISKEFVLGFDFLQLNHRSKDDLENLYLLTREGRSKSALKDYYTQRQAMDRFSLGAIILGEPSLSVIRRELKKLSPKAKFQLDDIREVVAQEVIKREIIEGDKAKEALKEVAKANRKIEKAKKRAKKQDPNTGIQKENEGNLSEEIETSLQSKQEISDEEFTDSLPD